MVVVPALTPVTIPVLAMVATAVLVLLHVPPAVASLNEVVEPLHTIKAPLIPGGVVGNISTVTTVVAATGPQVLGTV